MFLFPSVCVLSTSCLIVMLLPTYVKATSNYRFVKSIIIKVNKYQNIKILFVLALLFNILGLSVCLLSIATVTVLFISIDL